MMIHGYGIEDFVTYICIIWIDYIENNKGLPKLKFEKHRVCESCEKYKQTKASSKHKNCV